MRKTDSTLMYGGDTTQYPYTIPKNNLLLILKGKDFVEMPLRATKKRADAQLKGTWKSDLGIVTIEDSTAVFAGDSAHYSYKMSKDSLIIAFAGKKAFITKLQKKKKIEFSKIKGTWKSNAGTVIIADSTMSYPNDPKKHLYKLKDYTTLTLYFDMGSTMRAAEMTIEQLDEDSLVVNNDARTGYIRVR